MNNKDISEFNFTDQLTFKHVDTIGNPYLDSEDAQLIDADITINYKLDFELRSWGIKYCIAIINERDIAGTLEFDMLDGTNKIWTVNLIDWKVIDEVLFDQDGNFHISNITFDFRRKQVTVS